MCVKGDEEIPSTTKIIGVLLEALALPILIVVAVLLNMENKNLGMIGFLLGIGACMAFLGFILTRIPKEQQQNKTQTLK